MKKSIEEYMEKMDYKTTAWKISIPMVISMISIALYGIVDTIFISNLSENALNAISLAYPVQNTIIAIGLGIGIGINVVLSRAIGEKNKLKANNIIVNGFILSFISWILVAILSIFGIKGFFRFFTNDNEVIKLGVSYLSITSILSIGAIYQIIYEKILESYGKTKESMILQISGAIVNLILDPILIYGLLGAPKMGINGAAIATVIGQIFGMIVGTIFAFKNKIIQKSIFKQIKCDPKTMKLILNVGIPIMITETLSSVILLVTNKILSDISSLGVAVWGIYAKVEKFIFITIYGFNYGMMPMIGYCIGAGKKEKVRDIIKYFYKVAFTISVIGMLVFLVFAKQIISWFKVSNETLEIGVLAFRILSLGFIFQGTSTVLSAVFQCFEKSLYSLIISLFRKIFIAIPIILLLKGMFGLNIVWFSFTIAEIITTIIAIVLYKRTIHNLQNKCVTRRKNKLKIYNPQKKVEIA